MIQDRCYNAFGCKKYDQEWVQFFRENLEMGSEKIVVQWSFKTAINAFVEEWGP